MPVSSRKKTPRRAQPRTYAGAGVSIDEGDALVDFLKRANPAIGGFSALAALPAGLRAPRLVMSTDGVGTKLLVAQLAGAHATIGIDLVAMVVNDLVTCGARPLWFLDYFATGRLEPGVAREVMGGIIRGCREAGCALVGGETAEMPGMYAPGHYDLAGFGVGVVEKARAIDGRGVRAGDVILGLASDGLHSNGFSLARAALLGDSDSAARRALRRKFGGGTLARELLRPTRIYAKLALELAAAGGVTAMAHITGGGIAGNLVRVIPRGARAFIRLGSWPIPPIFGEIARRGPVDDEEMFRVFNMGVGFIAVVRPGAARRAIARCRARGVACRAIGWIDAAARGAEPSVHLLVPS